MFQHELTQKLKDRRDELVRELDALDAQAEPVKAELKTIEAALDVFEPERKQKKQRKLRKQPATAGEVKATVREILKEDSSLARNHDGLFSEVERRMVTAGKSKVGLTLRFKEAMKALSNRSVSEKPSREPERVSSKPPESLRVS